MTKKKITPKKTTNKKNKQVTRKGSSKVVRKNVNNTSLKLSKKEEVQKELSKSAKIIKLTIAFLIVCMLLYFLYINFIQIKDNGLKDGNYSQSQIEDIAKQKFALFNSKHNVDSNKLMFYTDNDLDMKSISNKDILYFAYTMLSLEDKNVNKDCNNNEKNCYLETFDTKVLDEQIYNYFDVSEIHHEDFMGSSALFCKLNNNKYDCSLENSNYDISNYNILSTYLSSRLDGDKLIIKSALLTIRRNNDKNYSEGIYSDVNATKKIDNLSYFLNDLNGLINNETTSLLSKKYENEITQYETVFVLKNKNYVWQSTKRIK